jgi:hypothetical protein
VSPANTFNLLTAAEDLSRLTVPKDIRYGIASLSRLLRATRPSSREWFWSQLPTVAGAVVAAAPDDHQWFESRLSGEVTGYMQIGKSHGRYSHMRPEGVLDDQIRPIENMLPPPTTLRDFLALLGKKLAIEDPVESTYVLARAQALREDENASAYAESRILIDALAASFWPQLSEATVMAEYEKSLHQRYLSFNIRGDLVGFMYMLTHTARAADPKRALSRALRESAPANAHTIYEFADFILSAVTHFDGGSSWIACAAGDLADETEVVLDRASNAKSVGEFYGAIFEAVPLAYGAKRAYTFLASATSVDQSAEYQRLANVSDERFATAVPALTVDFANAMDWRYLLAHRREIERERRQKGDWAAERLADEYIGLAMLYPTFFRTFLLGQTETLTLSAVESPRNS